MTSHEMGGGDPLPLFALKIINESQSDPNSEPPFGRGDDRSRNGRVLYEKIWSRALQSSLRMPGRRRTRARAAKRSGILCPKIRSHLWENSEKA